MTELFLSMLLLVVDGVERTRNDGFNDFRTIRLSLRASQDTSGYYRMGTGVTHVANETFRWTLFKLCSKMAFFVFNHVFFTGSNVAMNSLHIFNMHYIFSVLTTEYYEIVPAGDLPLRILNLD